MLLSFSRGGNLLSKVHLFFSHVWCGVCCMFMCVCVDVEGCACGICDVVCVCGVCVNVKGCVYVVYVV